MKGNRLLDVGVSDREEALAHCGDDIELFVKLAAQCLDVGFVKMALAAGKLPVAGEVAAGRPQSDKKCSVALDDGGHNDNRLQARTPCPKVSRTLEQWNWSLKPEA
jgi:hypothetical protein